MEIKVWSGWPFFNWSGYLVGSVHHIVLVIYVVSFIVLLLQTQRDFAVLRRRSLLFLLILLCLTPVLNSVGFLAVETPVVSPPVFPTDSQTTHPVSLGFPLLGLLPVGIGAAWMGVGPAAVLGLLAGVFRAGVTTHNLLDPFTWMVQAAVAAYLLQQSYRGRVAGLARQPFFAFLLSAILAQLLAMFSAFASVYQPDRVLSALDYVFLFRPVAARLDLVEVILVGAVLQLFSWVAPRIWPAVVSRQPAPYARTLNRRLQTLFIPFFMLAVTGLIYTVGVTAIDVATEQAQDTLARNAMNGAAEVLEFISFGQSLIRQTAGDSALWNGDETVCQARLQSLFQTPPYFNHLSAYDVHLVQGSDGSYTVEYGVLCSYPDTMTQAVEPTAEEKELLNLVYQTGSLQTTPVHVGPDGRVIFSFLGPIEDFAEEGRHGVLVGRFDIGMNPLLGRVLASLGPSTHTGEGFVVDADGRIVVHSDMNRLLETWQIDESQPVLASVGDGRGWIREIRDPKTYARQLTCYVEMGGYPWAVVIELPREATLELAARIATPLLIFLMVLTVAIGVIIPLATSQLTRPLELLSRAAGRIAEGNLTRPIQVVGDDEVARMGEAFEKMRVRLKGRLEDLSTLLQVAQDVSSTLDIAQGMSRVLEGALESTGALISRIVLLSVGGLPQAVIGRGEVIKGVAVLDRALSIAVCEADRYLLIENLRRTRALDASGPLPAKIQAAVAIPVRSRGRTVAVMWTGFADPHQFESSEVDFLFTLASQAAVLTENARLFQEAEGGRRQLAAILSSTGDAVLVTDREERLLLVNPAAEQALGVEGDRLVDLPVRRAPLEPDLIRVLTDPLDDGGLVEEVLLPGERTYYASASTILNADGVNMGRVVMMRDITHFKELEEIKAEFVAAVSHDLRSPLSSAKTFIQNLLDGVYGDLNDDQTNRLEMVLSRINDEILLVNSLLFLSRLEKQSLPMTRMPEDIVTIIGDIFKEFQPRAEQAGIYLDTEPLESTMVLIDRAMILRVLSNLLDNAIKFTYSGGRVTLSVESRSEVVEVRVEDTGIGIPGDQLDRVFDKFYQLDGSNTRRYGGTGLGLSIAKEIVELHGGTIWVQSEPGVGSIFFFTLPKTVV